MEKRPKPRPRAAPRPAASKVRAAEMILLGNAWHELGRLAPLGFAAAAPPPAPRPEASS